MRSSLHLEKKAIRALGVAESFRKNQKTSVLAGVVIRSDLVIDGFASGTLTVSGTDGTRAIIRLFRELNRNDVNAIMISGSVLSLYNVLDIETICKDLDLPVVALSFSKSASDLAANINARFPKIAARKKIVLLEKLGQAERIQLKTGYEVFVRSAGISKSDSNKLLDKFTLQGAIPEPIRVARLLAKTIAPLRAK